MAALSAAALDNIWILVLRVTVLLLTLSSARVAAPRKFSGLPACPWLR